VWPLGLTDGFVRAGSFAGAAVNALIGVDYVSAFALRDGAHRAHIGARATGNTNVGIDLSCHNCYDFIVVEFLLVRKFRHYI
jgi:hypothetical protein